MSEPSSLSQSVQLLLVRHNAGDESARVELIARPMERLQRIARSVLRTAPNVHRWEATDDLLQAAAMRLWQALRTHRPATPAEFFGLAGVCARRELIDLSRKLYGPEGLGANHASRASGNGDSRQKRNPEPADPGTDPGELAVWTEFHERIDGLPADDRLLFDLLWYQGLSQSEAAAIAGMPERTLRRRWRAARVKLDAALNGLDSDPADD